MSLFLRRRLCWERRGFVLLFFFFYGALFASTANGSGHTSQPGAIEQWWGGSHLAGNWWGNRQFLEGRGLDLGGSFSAVYHGVAPSRVGGDSIFCHCVSLTAAFDFEKMLGFGGLSGRAGIQWQTGRDINRRVGAGHAFSPAAFAGHWRWQLRPVDLIYVTPRVFGIKEFFTIAGGWQNPKDHLMLQSSASLFQNCAFGGGGGLLANGVAFDGSHLAWGGYARVRPTSWSHVQVGLWGAVPEGLSWRGRGAHFRLARPFKHSRIFAMGEMGITTGLGAALLPGKYVVGSFYWGVPNRSFLGATYPGQLGFYWQADQMLYREEATVLVDGSQRRLELNARVSRGVSARPQQGLYSFWCVSHAPKFNSIIPFFLRAGLLYKGPIPGWDKDELGIAFAFGNCSHYSVLARHTQGRFLQKTSEAIWEVDYRFQANKWLHVQPFLEYFFRPSSNSRFQDALVLGASVRLTF